MRADLRDRACAVGRYAQLLADLADDESDAGRELITSLCSYIDGTVSLIARELEAMRAEPGIVTPELIVEPAPASEYPIRLARLALARRSKMP